jgi:hypothetical protein
MTVPFPYPHVPSILHSTDAVTKISGYPILCYSVQISAHWHFSAHDHVHLHGTQDSVPGVPGALAGCLTSRGDTVGQSHENDHQLIVLTRLGK